MRECGEMCSLTAFGSLCFEVAMALSRLNQQLFGVQAEHESSRS